MQFVPVTFRSGSLWGISQNLFNNITDSLIDLKKKITVALLVCGFGNTPSLGALQNVLFLCQLYDASLSATGARSE